MVSLVLLTNDELYYTISNHLDGENWEREGEVVCALDFCA